MAKLINPPDLQKPVDPEAFMCMQILRLRCMMEGHRYGIEGVDKEPKDFCIYCGETREEKTNFSGISVDELVDKTLNSKD